MSRITGFDAANLIEAYNAVYTPQELTEEQVWEEVEAWVNSLVEEGHDLSEYTWEDMYEAYLNEGPYDAATVRRAQQAQSSRDQASAAASARQSAERRSQDVAQYRASMGSSPTASAKPTSTTFQNTGGFGRYQSPATQQYGNQSRFAGARDAAFARARQIKGSPVVGPRLVGPGSSSAPARPSPAPTRPAAPAAAPRPTTTAAVPNAPAAPRPSLTSQRAELEQMRKRSQQRIMAQGGTPATPLVQSFDPFDIVMGYLIDEGYAETEEAATVIMANMSEEWREEILEGRVASETMSSGERRKERNDRYREENPTLPSGNPTGPNAQLMRQMAHAKKRGMKKKKD